MMHPDLVYLRPDTLDEAVSAWAEYAQAGTKGRKEVAYLAGGTEIVTSARKTSPPHVLIDVSRLAELRQLGADEGRFVFGAALSLNEVGEARTFPLLSSTVRHIADRTTRNRLSLGGNIAGALPYREAVLPLLLADATVVTLTPGSSGQAPLRREHKLRAVFDKRLHLEPGELVVSFGVPETAVGRPSRHERATRTGPVDYPLVTACFLAGAGVAVAGLLSYPAWFADLAQARAAFAVPGAVKNDQRGSADYRLALFEAMTRRAQEATP